MYEKKNICTFKQQTIFQKKSQFFEILKSNIVSDKKFFEIDNDISLPDSSLKETVKIVEFNFPIQRAIKLSNDGCLGMFQPDHLKTRSQDLEKAYHDAGQFYWFSVEAIKREKKL